MQRCHTLADTPCLQRSIILNDVFIVRLSTDTCARLHRRIARQSFCAGFPGDRRYVIDYTHEDTRLMRPLIFSYRSFVLIGELNRAICWYLSCDKYWEDTKRPQRHTPWYLLTIFMLVLFSSIYACYYVIWVCFKYVVPKIKFLVIPFARTPARSLLKEKSPCIVKRN